MMLFFITVNNAVINPNEKLTFALMAMKNCSINVLFITATNVVINSNGKLTLKTM